jgi:hypothetical protein
VAEEVVSRQVPVVSSQSSAIRNQVPIDGFWILDAGNRLLET